MVVTSHPSSLDFSEITYLLDSSFDDLDTVITATFGFKVEFFESQFAALASVDGSLA